MNAKEIADLLEQVPMARRVGVPEVAAMLRKQGAAIRQLREALNAMVYEGHWSADEKAKASADEKAKAALAATENLHD